ncbi:MAG: ATP-binding protein [Armatimonadota bacterium]
MRKDQAEQSTVIAVASGKGGTGKTTVSTNLAKVLAGQMPVQYIDCDVEEPNGHLFLHPVLTHARDVTVPLPVIDETLCSHCGACAEACQYNALAAFPDFTLVLPELCHGCGACRFACPADAITERERAIGRLERGTAGEIAFLQGRLNIREVLSPVIIRELLSERASEGVVVIDAPPGTSCPVVNAVRPADIVLLVTEPTPFGLHDLELAVEMAETMGLSYAVVINRAGAGDDRVERFCEQRDIPVLARVPDNRQVAEAYSRGMLAVDAMPEARRWFEALALEVMNRMQTGVPAR